MANHLIDLTGQRFGNLTVIERDFSKPNSQNRSFWKCKCDCGNYSIVSSTHLRKGDIKSCGCIFRNDLTGKRFGRWTVIKKAERTTSQLWLCQCDCGTIKKVQHTSLVNGASTSCGCYHSEEVSKRLTTHGKSKTRIYNIYHNMRNRCYNKNNSRYADYGGRGIFVCKEWMDSFESFARWSYKNGYTDSMTIDRIDNDGPYSPVNCRWVNLDTQANNKRKTLYFEFFGVKMSLRQWIDFMGWNYKKYYGRFYRGYETFREEDVKKIEEKLKKE